MLSQVAHKSRKSVALSQSAVLAVLFKKIVVDDGIGCGSLVNPAFVEIFGKLAVGDNEFQLHKGGDVVVDAHDHGVRSVRVLGIVAEIGLTFLETHAVVASVLHDLVTNG